MLEDIADKLQNSTKTAFVINDIEYSYQDLALPVNNYYYYLKCHPQIKLVGIVMRNDLETYAMLVAALLSEAGYLILNLDNPPERISLIAGEAHLGYVCSSHNTDKAQLPPELIFIDLASLPENKEKFHYTEPDADSLAYILFTSGSTGNPKGVKITKGNLNALMQSFFEIPIEINDNDKVLQMFDLTFDGSVLMLFLPLSKGAAIYTTDPARIKYLDIGRILTTYPLTFVFLVPSVISLLKPFLAEFHFPSVRTFVVGAEATTNTLLNLIKPAIPNAAIWNLYGPTESTVCCLAYKVDGNIERELYNDVIPIGKVMPGFHTLIINNGKVIDKPMEKGELFIAGRQITPGYVNKEQNTNSAFHMLEFNNQIERFYATGDVVSVNEFGNIMYCGRIDHQVKIQGYRIELNEIEFHARQITKGTAIALVKEIDGNPHLYLFVEDYAGMIESVTAYLEQKLPSYMVPKNIMNIKQLPINTSNKIDRKALEDLITNTL